MIINGHDYLGIPPLSPGRKLALIAWHGIGGVELVKELKWFRGRGSGQPITVHPTIVADLERDGLCTVHEEGNRRTASLTILGVLLAASLMNEKSR